VEDRLWYLLFVREYGTDECSVPGKVHQLGTWHIFLSSRKWQEIKNTGAKLISFSVKKYCQDLQNSRIENF